MIILDERGFLLKNLEEKGFNVFDFFEHHQVLSVTQFCALPLQRRADMLLVDTQTLISQPQLQEKFRTIMNTFLGVVFFHEQSNQKAQQWVEENAAFLTKIVGEYALPMPQLQWSILSNQLQFFWNILQEQKNLQSRLAQFSLELDQVMQTTETEVIKARKIHEILIPKRAEEIKGVEFQIKYAAGEGGGGEFYDLIKTPQKVYQVLISSESYLLSSALLGILVQHKQTDFKTEAFLKDAEQEVQIINDSRKKKASVDLVIIELDLSQLLLKITGSKNVELYSQQKGKISPATEYQLSKKEKLIVFSPGFLFNWKEVHPKEDIQSFLQAQKSGLSELLPELFFQIKADQKSDFLRKDATVVMMEVKRHGIHQV